MASYFGLDVDIDVGDARPIQQDVSCVSPDKKTQLDKEVLQMLL